MPEADWLSLRQVGARLGFDKVATTRHHVEKAGLTRHEVVVRGRVLPYYEPDEVEALRQFLDEHPDISERRVLLRNSDPDWLTVQEAKARLGVSRSRALSILGDANVRRRFRDPRWLYAAAEVERVAKDRAAPPGFVRLSVAARAAGVSLSTMRYRIWSGAVTAVLHYGDWYVEQR